MVGLTYNEAWMKLGVPTLIENSDGTLEAIAPNTAVAMDNGRDFISAMATGDLKIRDETDANGVILIAEAMLENALTITDSAGAGTTDKAIKIEEDISKDTFGRKVLTGLIGAAMIGATLGAIVNNYVNPDIGIDCSVEKTDVSKIAHLWLNGTGFAPINDASMQILNESGITVIEKAYTPFTNKMNIEEIINMTSFEPGNYTLKLKTKNGLFSNDISKKFELPNLPPIIDIFNVSANGRTLTSQAHAFDLDGKISDVSFNTTRIGEGDNLETWLSPWKINGSGVFDLINANEITQTHNDLPGGVYQINAHARDKFGKITEIFKTASIINPLPVVKDFFLTDEGKLVLNATDDLGFGTAWVNISQNGGERSYNSLSCYEGYYSGSYLNFSWDGIQRLSNLNLTKGLWGDIKLDAFLIDTENGLTKQTIWKNITYGGLPQLKSLNIIARQQKDWGYSGNMSVFCDFEDDVGIWKKLVNGVETNDYMAFPFSATPEWQETIFDPAVKNFTKSLWINGWELDNRNGAILAHLWDVEGNYVKILKDLGLSDPINTTLTLNNTKQISDGLLNSLEDLVGTEKMPNFWLNATHPVGLFSAAVGMGVYDTPEHALPGEELGVPPIGDEALNASYPIKILNTTLNQFNFYGGELPKQVNVTGNINLSAFFGYYTLLMDMTKFGRPYPKMDRLFKNITIPNWAPVLVGFNVFQDNDTGETNLFYNATDLESGLANFELTAINKDTLERIPIKTSTLPNVNDVPFKVILPSGRYGFEFNLTDYNNKNRIITPFNEVIAGPGNDDIIKDYPKIISTNLKVELNKLVDSAYAEGLAYSELVEENLIVKAPNGTIVQQETNIFPPAVSRWSNFTLNNLAGLDSILLELSYRDKYGKKVFLNKTVSLNTEPTLDLSFEPLEEISTDGYLTNLDVLLNSIKIPKFNLSGQDDLGIYSMEISTPTAVYDFQNWPGAKISGVLPDNSLVNNCDMNLFAGTYSYNDPIFLYLSSILPDGEVMFKANLTRWNMQEKTIFQNVTVPNVAPFVQGFTAPYNNITNKIVVDGEFIDLEKHFKSYKIYAVNHETGEKLFLCQDELSSGLNWERLWISPLHQEYTLPPGDYDFEAQLSDWEGNFRNVTVRNKVNITQPSLDFSITPEFSAGNEKLYRLLMTAEGYDDLDRIEMLLYKDGVELPRDALSTYGKALDPAVELINQDNFTTKQKQVNVNQPMYCFYPFYGNVDMKVRLYDTVGRMTEKTKLYNILNAPPEVKIWSAVFNPSTLQIDYHWRAIDWESCLTGYSFYEKNLNTGYLSSFHAAGPQGFGVLESIRSVYPNNVGIHQITGSATDEQGNVGTTQSVLVSVP